MKLCYPNQLYVQNLITCICTKDGRWPHKSCQDTFQALPPSNVIKHKCDPDTYVRIDCNICRCGPDGDIISDRCTRNSCDDEIKRRAYPTTNSVYSSCEIKNWYSLAPCQFCFCVNQNKLMCNTGNDYSNRLELGSYNLKVCGKDLIREAIELIPDNQKALRLGLRPNNISTITTQTNFEITTTRTPKAVFNVRDDHNIAIEVNREKNENKTIASNPQKLEEISSSKDEYYTDSEEETAKPTQTPKPTVTTVTVTTEPTVTRDPQDSKDLSTKFPYEEGDEMLNESEVNNEDNNDDNNEDNEDSNEIIFENNNAVSSTSNPITESSLQGVAAAQQEPQLKELHAAAREGKSGESYQYIGNTLKINLPKVLNKVFQLALRKSMVSLSKGTKCVPGSTTMNDCNMCFCLKNSKLLCTNNNCIKN